MEIDVRKGSYTHIVGHSEGFDVTPGTSSIFEDEKGYGVCYSDANTFFNGVDTDDIVLYDAQFEHNKFILEK